MTITQLFPGGLIPRSYLSRLKEQGIRDVDDDMAFALHKGWFEAFPEMKEHMKAVQIAGAPDEYYSYMAQTFTGRIRRFCSRNSACNFRFQGPVSDGVKRALWALNKAGLNICSVIHDEIQTYLPESEASDLMKEQERIMIEEMVFVIPDVKIKVESALMRRWYKGAPEMRDAAGRMIPVRPREITEDGKKKVVWEPDMDGTDIVDYNYGIAPEIDIPVVDLGF